MAKPPKMRMQFWEARGLRVLDDCYNANADSMLAALQTLADLPCAGQRVAVLGDMAELGEHTAAAHEEIGRRAAELKIDRVVAVGKFAKGTADTASEGGLEAKIFSDVTAAASELPKLVKAGDLILLKASRSTGLERVGEALRNSPQ
jgi:UDP-N-acetylmuramoyl-tripeptide--D-alanyl-D-alanine ligase